ncbi:hypothetical protein ILUMI_08001, partial [Ignelater luminosus]
TLPKWMVTGTTYLRPKSEDTTKAINYRPITCLPTLYKNMTAVVSNRLFEYLYNNDIVPKEQKGNGPLTCELNRLNCGYQMKNENVKVNNLLYMDDLKIFGKNEQELRKEMKVIQTSSTDIGMKMGLKKCAKLTFKRGER